MYMVADILDPIWNVLIEKEYIEESRGLTLNLLENMAIKRGITNHKIYTECKQKYI